MYQDKENILQNIMKKEAFFVMNAVINGTKANLHDDDFIAAVKNNKTNSDTIMNVPVNYVAIAALHLLEIEKYNGTEQVINSLIESKFDF